MVWHSQQRGRRWWDWRISQLKVERKSRGIGTTSPVSIVRPLRQFIWSAHGVRLPLYGKGPRFLARVTPTSWLSSSGSLGFLLAAEVLPAPTGCMSWMCDSAAHLSCFPNSWLRSVGRFFSEMSLTWFLTLMETVIAKIAESHCKVVWMDLTYCWNVTVLWRPFTQTILNMGYLNINILISYSWALVVSNDTPLWVQKTSHVDR